MCSFSLEGQIKYTLMDINHVQQSPFQLNPLSLGWNSSGLHAQRRGTHTHTHTHTPTHTHTHTHTHTFLDLTCRVWCKQPEGIEPLCSGEDKMVRQRGLNSPMQRATYSLGSLGAGNPLHWDAISGLLSHSAGPAGSKTTSGWCYEDRGYWGMFFYRP